jgi:hypothetical protein
MSEKIFLIEKGWIDPMENKNATGYKTHSYVKSEKEAIDFCEKNGYWTGDDCWEIRLSSNDKMYKYRYTEVKILNKE